jgi:hypothetical protein
MSAEKKEPSLSDLLKESLERQKAEDDIPDDPTKYDASYRAQLAANCKALLQPYVFQVGQLVKWKKGLQNRKLPKEYQPAIVVAVLDNPVLNDEKETGSTYFREPLDIVLGMTTDEGGSFITFYYDKRRFEPCES